MNTIGLWSASSEGPERLVRVDVAVERDLEDWIERDPALLANGLVIVGRQISLEGGLTDLLALDPQGRWVLIEIKKGRLRRKVIAQAIDYASCLSRLSPNILQEQCDRYLNKTGSVVTLKDLLAQRGCSLEPENQKRDVIIYLVGAGVDAGLERMCEYLVERSDITLKLVSFSSFRDQSGNTLLAREIHESTDGSVLDGVLPSATSSNPDAVFALADQNGVGQVLRTLYSAATELRLCPRYWPRSIMFAPQANRTRCLFTVWADRISSENPGMVKVWFEAEAFEQFYGIDESTLVNAIKLKPGYTIIDQKAAEQACLGLRQLLGDNENE